MNLQLIAIRTYYKTLSTITPKVAANKAFLLFQKVRIKKIRHREQDFYDQAKEVTIPNQSFDYQMYEMGNPQGKPVLLIHGWDSNIGSLYKFAFELAKKNYRVIGINLPAHGFSKAKRTNMLECKDLFKEVVNHYDFNSPFAIISHSFGSGVVGYALSELKIVAGRIVFLTVPNKIEDIFLEFKKIIGLGNKAYQKMVDQANEVLGEDLSGLSIADKLQDAHFEKAIIIHDKYDKILPFANAEAIANGVEGVTLKPFEKIGHYRMLWTDKVVQTAINFLEDEA